MVAQCVGPGGVRTALVPTAVCGAASPASTWLRQENASVSGHLLYLMGRARCFSLEDIFGSYLAFVHYPQQQSLPTLKRGVKVRAFLARISKLRFTELGVHRCGK